MEFIYSLTPGQFGATLGFAFLLFRLGYTVMLMEPTPDTYRPFGPELASLALSISVGLMGNSEASRLLGNALLLVVHILMWVLLWVWTKQRAPTASPPREWASALLSVAVGTGMYVLAVSRLWSNT